MTRRLGFRCFATVLAVLALAQVGCMKKQEPKGELLGAYAISGVLLENSCGQAALPTQNPLDFVAEIRNASGVITWQLDKQPAYAGVLRAGGEYRFVSESQIPMGEQVSRTANEPTDFLSLEPDFDIKRANCTLLMKESIFGTLHRMRELDGGVLDADAGAAEGADLAGDNTIEVEQAAGSDCSALLASQGGAFLTLPCAARYSLEGTLLPDAP